MARLLSRALIGALLLPSGAVHGQSSPADPLLVLGIRQVDDGNFEEAVFTLDTAVRRLAGHADRTRDLVEAYVYLGTAYVGLDHEDAAKGKFRRALELAPQLRLSPERFPPRVVKLFDELALDRTVTRKKRSARRFVILGGVGAGAAVGIAAATRGSELPANRVPAGVGITVTPGRGIAGVTTIALTGTAADPDGDPVTFTWDLGDGTTATGQAVRHVYRAEGDFPAALTVTDGRGGSAAARSSVVARTLTGHWQVVEGHDEGDVSDTQCVQSGSLLECQAITDAPVSALRGTISDPFRMDLEAIVRGETVQSTCEVRPSLNCFECSFKGGVRRYVRPQPGGDECSQ